jgi:hypothetical protein
MLVCIALDTHPPHALSRKRHPMCSECCICYFATKHLTHAGHITEGLFLPSIARCMGRHRLYRLTSTMGLHSQDAVRCSMVIVEQSSLCVNGALRKMKFERVRTHATVQFLNMCMAALISTLYKLKIEVA